MATPEPLQVADATFTDAAPAVLNTLQQACAGILDALPTPIHRAVDLERALKIDKKLAWQVFKIARSPHPLAEGLNVPPRTAVKRLVAAARKQRVPPALLTQFDDAFEAFETLVADHAGDRETFRSLMASMVSDVSQDVTDKYRLDMFRAASHLWGLRADSIVRSVIIYPDQAGKLSVATVYGFVNLHRLRNGPPALMTVGQGERWFVDRQPNSTDRPAGKQDLPMLLEAFSSRSVGRVTWLPHPELTGRTQLQLEGLGRGASASFFTLQIRHTMGDDPTPEIENCAGIATPTKVLFCDLLVPSGFTNPATAKVIVYGSRSEFPTPQWIARPTDLLPNREHVQTFAPIAVVPKTPEVPHYQQAMHHIIEKLGCGSMQFDLYRCRVEFPFFHTIIGLTAERAATDSA